MKSDGQLQQDILDELMFEPSVNEAHIGVSVTNGVVTLSGHVPTYAEKFAAETAAKRVFGVRAVADELDVKIPGSSMRTDEDIANACLSALKHSTAIPSEKIKVIVSDGRVTLEGEVDWQYQRTAAMNSVRYLWGVTDVRNNIMIKPNVLASDVKKKIEAAFKRSAELDARRVDVELANGEVVLSGNVRSLAEWEEAQQAAWAAPGVNRVDNRICVTP